MCASNKLLLLQLPSSLADKRGSENIALQQQTDSIASLFTVSSINISVWLATLIRITSLWPGENPACFLTSISYWFSTFTCSYFCRCSNLTILQEGNEMLSHFNATHDDKWKGLNQMCLGNATHYSNNSIKLIPAVSILHSWVHLLIVATKKKQKRKWLHIRSRCN